MSHGSPARAIRLRTAKGRLTRTAFWFAPITTHSAPAKTRRYVVEAEQYQHHVYVLKFYPLAHKNSVNRFKLLLNDGDAFRILSTCMRVFADVFKRDSLSSAGFVGEASLGENRAFTKRFRIYFQAVITFVEPALFIHHPMPGISAYFLERRANPEPDLKAKAEKMFRELYIVPQVLDEGKPVSLNSGNGG